MKKKCLIFDIDGVLCDPSDRQKKYIDFDAKAKGDKKSYYDSIESYNKADHKKDKVLALGKNLYEWSIQQYQPDKIFIVTARFTDTKFKTKQWLKHYGFFKDNVILVMRPVVNSEDYETKLQKIHDKSKYKKDVALKIMKEYEILLAVDDKMDNCQEYKKLNIPTIHLIACELPL